VIPVVTAIAPCSACWPSTVRRSSKGQTLSIRVVAPLFSNGARPTAGEDNVRLQPRDLSFPAPVN
jgi:hypothetical protein